MADVAKLQTNFLKYGTPLPTLKQRVRSFLGLKSAVGRSLKSDTFIPASAFVNVGIGTSIADISKTNAIREGWNKNATVYSIIRKIARTCAMAPWGVYQVVDDQAYKRYKAMSSQQTSGEHLHMARTKALKPVEGHRLNNIYANPNPIQSGNEYTEALITYKLLTGDAYEWANMLQFGKNGGTPGEFWPLPSHMMTIYTNGNWPIMVDRYVLFDGRPREFTPAEVLHSKYFNPNYSYTGMHLYGFSPLQAAWLNMQQDNDARDAGIEILQNRGPRKLIAIDSPAMTTPQQAKEQAGRLKERWREEMLESRGGIVLMPGTGSAIDVGLGINDMKILEISDYTRDDLCNVYGMWAGLLNGQGTQTHDNVAQYKKDFITNVVLPELNSLRDARNYKLRTDWGYKAAGIVVDYDPTVYAELQEDMAKLATWLDTAWWFTPNKKLTYMNESPEKDPAMDRVYIPSTLVPIDEVGMSTMPDQTGLNDYGNGNETGGGND